MKIKSKLTKAQLKVWVNEEAKAMKAHGVPLTLVECKREAEKVFRQEFEII
jgi:hypothetical protein